MRDLKEISTRLKIAKKNIKKTKEKNNYAQQGWGNFIQNFFLTDKAKSN